MLDRHDHVSIAPESLFLINIYFKYGNKLISNETELNKVIDDIFKDQKILKWWKIDKDGFTKHIQKFNLPISTIEIIKQVYVYYAIKNDNQEIALLGDKNPEYSLHIKTILEIFPNAKIIHLVRDPRANIASYKNVSFDLNNATMLATRWNNYNKEINNIKNKYPSQVKIIKFEKLITDPQYVLNELTTFLNVDLLEVLEMKPTGKNLFSWNNKNKSNVLDKTVLDKWKKELTDADINNIERATHKLANSFGYKIKRPKNSISLGYIFNYNLGIVINKLELIYFRLPFRLKLFIISLYRKRTKVLKT